MTVSVVIPTHDRCELLHRALKSVLTQTVQPNEIIVVDDLNDKKTKELCESFPNDIVRHIPNTNGKGASSSRNLGVEKSNSEFVAFLDDDDVWLPEKLEKQMKLIRSKDLDACFSQLLVKYEGTNISYATKAKNVINPKQDILIENYLGATISAIVKRTLFIQVAGFNEQYKAREEYDLWIKIIHNNARIGVVEEPLAISYRSLENRNRISLNINSYIEAIDLLNSKYSKLVCQFLSNQQKKHRKKKQYDFLAAQAVSIGFKKAAVENYYRSLSVAPSLKSFLGLVVSMISPKLLIKLREKII